MAQIKLDHTGNTSLQTTVGNINSMMGELYAGSGGSSGTITGDLNVSGNAIVVGTILGGNIITTGAIQAQGVSTFFNVLVLGVMTVAAGASQLPGAGAGLKGAVACVTDATSPTYRGVLSGGGAVTCLVFCDGTNWRT